MRRSPPTCTRCRKNPSIYYRPYSGERLCPGCFVDSVRVRVERTIAQFEMLRFNDRIAVGVSGGKDSLNLLNILTEIEAKFPRAELIAITVDEGIRGYRDEALGFVKNACERLGVESLVLSFKELFGYTLDEIITKIADKELTPCSYCGVLRRRALNEAAKSVQADRLATAHNLDDTAQTVLLNLMRGDLRRLSEMHPAGGSLPGFVRRVKPFCEVPERESALLAYLRGVEFQSTPCPYAGDAMRNDIRNFLANMETKRPGTLFTIFRSAMEIIPKMSKDIPEHTKVCKVCGEPTPMETCRVCQLLTEIN